MSGWFSCGMVMDWLRSCYRSSMRLYTGQPGIATPGRWYFCADDAKPLPFEHVFASQVWDKDKDLDPPLGEVRGLGKYYRGDRNPRLTGQRFCGAKILYSLGSPLTLRGTPLSDADGVPLCCEVTDTLGEPTIFVVGGQSAYQWGNIMTASGGGVEDGSGQWGNGWFSTGGGEEDGTAIVGLGFDGFGGGVEDGAGFFNPGYPVNVGLKVGFDMTVDLEPLLVSFSAGLKVGFGMTVSVNPVPFSFSAGLKVGFGMTVTTH